ncbi:2,3-dehydroadipyl-CoA hydratase-like [Thrips palmi]|uniref:2,3-dehydroadipyl-CoA hydratase-like n=1 Tax=Thrips palmi TaxID=161013 RepID=A0A6P8YI98_THRPL|nr:2,3-dehydroadipyl-CoA hydratase-like [Thrips palmi]
MKFHMIVSKLTGPRLTRMFKAPFHTSLVQREENSSSLDEQLILVEHYNAVTLIGLNRPSKRNALNAELIDALRKELKVFESNQSSTVAVLYGTGGNFCAGLDLETVSSNQLSIPLVDEFCTKPVVASLNGYAVGEGFDLAMACDVRIMDDHSILGSFNRRFGVPMSIPAIRRLAASVGFSLALELILSGRPIKAEEALQKNLVHQLVACGSSKGNALTYAQSLTKFPQEALRADRAALYHSLSLSEDIQQAVNSERISALQEAQKELQSHCKRFKEGTGKHGTFKNLTVQTGFPDWMKS